LLASCLPVISVHHNYNDYTRFSRRWFIQLFKRRLLMLGVSDSVRDDLRRDLKGWPAGNIQTLYNRINVAAVQSELLEKNVARQMLGLPQEAWIIGNVGRLHHDKDQATLIRAFHQADHELPQNSLLVIMGKGPLEAELKRLARGLSIEHKVVFTGNVPNARQYFKAFNVFALTSDREPFGMVLLEAMAAVLPIICSDCGGGAEVVREVGQLFPFGDVSALSKLMVIQSKIPTPLLEHQTQRLQGHFSDEAAKHHFWQLVSNGAVNLNRHD
jgi:glycosyltransferase involved in cell wall biosynthesis